MLRIGSEPIELKPKRKGTARYVTKWFRGHAGKWPRCRTLLLTCCLLLKIHCSRVLRADYFLGRFGDATKKSDVAPSFLLMGRIDWRSGRFSIISPWRSRPMIVVLLGARQMRPCAGCWSLRPFCTIPLVKIRSRLPLYHRENGCPGAVSQLNDDKKRDDALFVEHCDVHVMLALDCSGVVRRFGLTDLRRHLQPTGLMSAVGAVPFCPMRCIV